MQTNYPNWVMAIALIMILAGILPIPVVFLLRSFQCLKYDLDIHQGSIRRNETTASTKEMIDEDDVSIWLLENKTHVCNMIYSIYSIRSGHCFVDLV